MYFSLWLRGEFLIKYTRNIPEINTEENMLLNSAGENEEDDRISQKFGAIDTCK